MNRTALRLGTRASRLALVQAEMIAAVLRQIGERVEVVHISTTGDERPDAKLSSMGGVGVFTKEIQRALLDARIDLAVHSLKDLPTQPHAGLMLAATPRRTTADDVFVSMRYRWATLPADAVVGTGSLRRVSQLLHQRPELRIRAIRGNIETRLGKLASGEYDAILLSAVSLDRLGLVSQVPYVERLRESAGFCPAVGQGVIGVEIRESDESLCQTLQWISDPLTMTCVTAERAMLRTLDAGCSAPIGGFAEILENGENPAKSARISLHGRILSEDGASQVDVRGTEQLDGRSETTSNGCGAAPTAWLDAACRLGRRVGEELQRRDDGDALR